MYVLDLLGRASKVGRCLLAHHVSLGESPLLEREGLLLPVENFLVHSVSPFSAQHSHLYSKLSQLLV